MIVIRVWGVQNWRGNMDNIVELLSLEHFVSSTWCCVVLDFNERQMLFPIWMFA